MNTNRASAFVLLVLSAFFMVALASTAPSANSQLPTTTSTTTLTTSTTTTLATTTTTTMASTTTTRTTTSTTTSTTTITRPTTTTAPASPTPTPAPASSVYGLARILASLSVFIVALAIGWLLFKMDGILGKIVSST